MATFSNNGILSIPDNGTAHDFLAVSGLTGVRFRVSLKIFVTHSYPNDLDILLVGPDNKSNLEVMSDYGGAVPLSNSTSFNFADWGGVPISSAYTNSFNGYLYPTDLDLFPELTSNWQDLPLTVTSINHPQQFGSANFANSFANFANSFGGVNPNGAWSLWVRDDSANSTGTVDSWTLTINALPLSHDFTGDQKGDLLWRFTGGQISVWSGGGANFTQTSFGGASNDWTILGEGDFNTDGKIDILWRNANGALSQWYSTGANFSPSAAGSMALNWNMVGIGDFTGEGRDDIAWQNELGAVQIETALNGFSNIGSLGPDFHVQAVADFNGDGKADLLFRETIGRVNIWLNGPTTSFVPQDYGLIGPDWTLQRAADFNGDGFADILWRNTNDRLNLWTSTGSNFTTRDLGPLGSDWSVQGVTDENGDGCADIVFRNTSGFVSIWDGSKAGSFTNHNVGFVDNAWKLQL